REGNLYIFELKRWVSSAENLLQVLRYGQVFGQYDYAALDHLFQSYLGRVGSTEKKPLMTAHKAHFELTEELPSVKFNERQRFIVVTNGLDRQTREAIDYW